jgi:hypothetical protein
MELPTRSLSIINRSRKDTAMAKGNNSQKNDKKNKKPKKDAKTKEIKPLERIEKK